MSEIKPPPAIAREPHAADDPNHPDHYSQKDLRAQQSMARSTEAIVYWTRISVAFGVIGAGAILWTLLETRRATAATREVGRDQSRAYVHASEGYFFWGGEQKQSPHVRITVRNTGATPAKWFKVRCKTGVHIVADGSAQSAVDQHVLGLPDVFSCPYAGISDDPRNVRFSTDDDEKALSQAGNPLSRGTHWLIVAGEVAYCSFFDELFRTQFVFYTDYLKPYRSSDTDTRNWSGINVSDAAEVE